MVIRANKLAELLGCPSARAARELAKQPGFPSAVELSPGRRGWILSEVEAWIESRKVQRLVSIDDLEVADELHRRGDRGRRRGPIRKVAA